jgi:hypothetical protein
MTANIEDRGQGDFHLEAHAALRLPVTTSSIGLEYDFKYEFRQRSDVPVLLECSFGSNREAELPSQPFDTKGASYRNG